MSWITMQIILAVLIFGLIGILWLLKDKNPTYIRNKKMDEIIELMKKKDEEERKE